MIQPLIIFLVELFILYLLSGAMTTTIFSFFARLFRSNHIAISLTTALLFLGTIIHELSHLFIAEILGVRTGKLTLTPEGLGGTEGSGGEIRAGSVAIAKADPIRRTMIGIAPVVVGMVVLMAIAYMMNTTDRTDTTNTTYIIKTIQYYLLFAISNSMFSSKEDMKGVIPVFITLGLFAGAAYFAGLRIGLTGQAEIIVIRVLDTLTKSLGLVLAVNVVILLVLKVLLAIKRIF